MTVYKRKAKKTGSSIQATIPKEIAQELGIEPGDIVVYRRKENGEIVLEKEQTLEEETGLSPEFLGILQEGMNEYEEALKSLVNK